MKTLKDVLELNDMLDLFHGLKHLYEKLKKKLNYYMVVLML